MSELYCYEKYKGVKVFVEYDNNTFYANGVVNGTTLYFCEAGTGELALKRLKQQVDKDDENRRIKV